MFASITFSAQPQTGKGTKSKEKESKRAEKENSNSFIPFVSGSLF